MLVKFSLIAASLFAASSVSALPTGSRHSLVLRQGTQFITGPCGSDADCASGCCNAKTALCAARFVAEENGGPGCGFGGSAPPAPAPAPAAPAPAAPAPANPGKPPGTQFITGPCGSDADCASGCCNAKTALCAARFVAEENGGPGCGFGGSAAPVPAPAPAPPAPAPAPPAPAPEPPAPAPEPPAPAPAPPAPAPAPPAPAPPAPAPPAASTITPQQVLGAAPGSASCDGTASCRTADQAAPFIDASFKKFGFSTPGEQAALIALMAFETGDFKFDVNVFPGRPGQGTRNLMTFPFILKYALDTPEVAPQVATIDPSLNANMSFDQANAVNPDTMNRVRALVLSDELSFASAAWFLKTQCGPEIAQGLQQATAAAWTQYMVTCIGTTDAPERLVGYQTALRAFGL